jgi:DNA polymerase III gamma/tau subunit
MEAITAKDAEAGLNVIRQTLDAGTDPRQFTRQVVDALRGVLMLRMGAKLGPEFGNEEGQRMQAQAKAFSLPDLLRVIRLFNEAAGGDKVAWLPSLPLEMAFVESIAASNSDANAAPSAAQPAQAAAPQTAAKPAPKASAQSAPAESAPAPSSVQVDHQSWTRIKEAVKARDPHVLALLNSVKTRELRGDTLLLGFASDILKERMQKPETLEMLIAVLDQVIGGKLQVECFLSSCKAGELPPGLDSSGMVAAAVRLGGEIVDSNDLGKNAE